jgi:hypothetical protein
LTANYGRRLAEQPSKTRSRGGDGWAAKAAPEGAPPNVLNCQIFYTVLRRRQIGGGLAYSTDVAELDDRAFAVIEGAELWIIDCLRRDPFRLTEKTLS